MIAAGRDLPTEVWMDFLPAGRGETGNVPADSGTPGNPKIILMVLAPGDFNDDEYSICRDVFDSAASGATGGGLRSGTSLCVRVCCPKTGFVRGSFGTWVEVDMGIFDVDLCSCAAVVFIGGSGVSACLESRSVIKLAKDAADSGCVVGALCAAPGILARAGLLMMRPATGHPVARVELRNAGAVLVDAPLVVSERIVTAAGPFAARDFAEKIVEMARLAC